MKITLLISLFFMLTLCAFAQEVIEKNKENLDTTEVNTKTLGDNEINTNVLMLGIISVAELNYERLFKKTGIGLSASMDLGDTAFNYSFATYYRRYFGKRKASGFFIEGNAIFYNAEKSSVGRYLEDGTYREYKLIEDQYGFGVGVGVKFLNSAGFVGEIRGGVAKVFGGTNNFYPRIGITLGKRFY